MASVATMSPSAILGTHSPSTKDFDIARAIYTALPHADGQVMISPEVIEEVATIFTRYKAQDRFGIQLLHGHFNILEADVVLSTEVPMTKTSHGVWTRLVPAAELKGKKVHGYMFRLSSDATFISYKFRAGEAPALDEGIDPAFFNTLAEFLQRNGLADILALELLSKPQSHVWKEIDIDPQSTILLHEDDAIGLTRPTITTGWSFAVGDDGIVSCKGGTVHASKTNGKHQVFIDTKPLPTVEALKQALREEGILV